MKIAVCWQKHFYSSIAGESSILPATILLNAEFFFRDYLRESVRSIGGCRGEGGEESSTASCFNCVDHSLLRLAQMRRLSEGADEHKHIIHPWEEQKSCIII